MKKLLLCLQQFFQNCYHIFESCFAILLFSKLNVTKVPYPVGGKKSCFVLGNGPSLNSFMETYVRDESHSIYVVNFFCLSNFFTIIKPDKYVFIDSSLYHQELDDERVSMMMSAFAKVDWQMTYYYPAHYSRSKFIKDLTGIGNPNLILQSINVTPVDGPLKFRNFIYRHKLGMPKCYNVLNASLCCAINDGNNYIYMVGADHSWLSQLFFDENGNLCTRNEHFYQTSGDMFIMPKGSLETGLLSFAYALKSYRYIDGYAQYLGIKIYNLYKNSYIDIFEKI